MGSSYVDFRGHELRVSDGSLQIWLHLMLKELPDIDALKELRSAWAELARARYAGWLDPGFERLLDERNLVQVREAAKRVAERQLAVPRAELEREQIGADSQWTRDVEMSALKGDFIALERLLDADPNEEAGKP